MSVTISGQYLGNKRTELTHGPSGAKVQTSAPVDNQGDGLKFSPTDLFAGSLGACMLTIMGIVADRDGISLENTSFSVVKEMAAAPRRVSALTVEFKLPKALDEAQRAKLERAAETCPVHHSLHPDITVSIKYSYEL